MEVAGKSNTGSSLPPNYLSLVELRERWLQKKRARGKAEEEHKSKALVQEEPKKEEDSPKTDVDEAPQTEARSTPASHLAPTQKRNNRRNGRRTAAGRVQEPASKQTETVTGAIAAAEEKKKVGGVVIDGRKKKQTPKVSNNRPDGGAGAAAGSELDKRAAMALPVAAREEQRKPEIGIYDRVVAEGKAMERKGSVNRFNGVENKFEKLWTSVGDERGRHRSGMDHKSGFCRGIGGHGRWSYRSGDPRLPPACHGFVWIKKGEGSSAGDGKQVNDHSIRSCD